MLIYVSMVRSSLAPESLVVDKRQVCSLTVGLDWAEAAEFTHAAGWNRVTYEVGYIAGRQFSGIYTYK